MWLNLYNPTSIRCRETHFGVKRLVGTRQTLHKQPSAAQKNNALAAEQKTRRTRIRRDTKETSMYWLKLLIYRSLALANFSEFLARWIFLPRPGIEPSTSESPSRCLNPRCPHVIVRIVHGTYWEWCHDKNQHCSNFSLFKEWMNESINQSNLLHH